MRKGEPPYQVFLASSILAAPSTPLGRAGGGRRRPERIVKRPALVMPPLHFIPVGAWGVPVGGACGVWQSLQQEIRNLLQEILVNSRVLVPSERRRSAPAHLPGLFRRASLSELISRAYLANSSTQLIRPVVRFCQYAFRSCGSPSAALQPMLCPRGLGAILSTGDSLSANSAGAADCSWSGAGTAPSILLNNCELRPHRQRLAQRFDWCESVARKMASARWDDGACLQPHCLAGWCRGLQAQDRVLTHMVHFVHPDCTITHSSQ